MKKEIKDKIPFSEVSLLSEIILTDLNKERTHQEKEINIIKPKKELKYTNMGSLFLKHNRKKDKK